MAAWDNALKTIAVDLVADKAIEAVGNQIYRAKESIVEDNIYDGETEEFKKWKAEQEKVRIIEEHNAQNVKPASKSKIIQTSAIGGIAAPLVVMAASSFGVNLTLEEQTLAVTAISLVTSAFTIYLRKYKTTTLIK